LTHAGSGVVVRLECEHHDEGQDQAEETGNDAEHLGRHLGVESLRGRGHHTAYQPDPEELLRDPVTTFQGAYITLTDARCEPEPVQRPHPPITIGGRGPRRTLGAVARWAQAWNVIVTDAAGWRPLKDTLRTRCAEADRDPAEITCSVNVRIDDDVPPEQAIEAALGQIADFTDAGVDLVVLNLPLDATPEILRPLAEAVTPLR
jgi:alkanesulfonate monooxygenase SsuD/methylene tetrahydromethanopterin reductase-like flavin-dependent oxidoreductase (luciferase family)